MLQNDSSAHGYAEAAKNLYFDLRPDKQFGEVNLYRKTTGLRT